MVNKILEQNLVNSFSLAKQDIGELYEHVKFLLEEVRHLKKENLYLASKVQELGLKLNVPVSTTQLVASRQAQKLHRSDCVFAKNIKSSNKRVFESKTKAFKAGYQLCNCLVC